MPDTEILIVAPLVVFMAYAILGIAGFGSTVVAVPLLAHLVPLTFLIPMTLLLDCLGALSMSRRLRGEINRHELLPLLPFLLAGLGGGVFLLVRLPREVLLLFLGCFVLSYGLIYLARRASVLRLPRWSAAPVGLVAGTISSAFGMGGPIYVMYFTSRGLTPEQMRATLPVIFIVTTTTRIALLAGAGLFTQEVLMAAGALLPFMALGMYCGNRLHGRISREAAVRIIGALLTLSGLSLLVRALA